MAKKKEAIKKKIAELDAKIKELDRERFYLQIQLISGDRDKLVAKLVGQWVMIPGFNEFDESRTPVVSYRLCRIKRGLEGLPNNWSYKFEMESMAYIDKVCKEGNGGIYFPKPANSKSIEVNDIRRIKVLSAKDVKKRLELARSNTNLHVQTILDRIRKEER